MLLSRWFAVCVFTSGPDCRVLLRPCISSNEFNTLLKHFLLCSCMLFIVIDPRSLSTSFDNANDTSRRSKLTVCVKQPSEQQKAESYFLQRAQRLYGVVNSSKDCRYLVASCGSGCFCRVMISAKAYYADRSNRISICCNHGWSARCKS